MMAWFFFTYNLSDNQYCEVPPTQYNAYPASLLTAPFSPVQDVTSLPPRKRVHHMMPGFEVLNNAALQAQTMGLQS
jgi:hypothetical protein